MGKKEELGQVFTNSNVAKLMVSLIKSKIKDQSKILDPCIGKNIFFQELSKICSAKYLVGIEIDKDLITESILNFYTMKGAKLINDDFINLPIEEKFDLIIMNPPYIRQEMIGNTKNSWINFSRGEIPKNSNLYIYFLLKALSHLKSGGDLVAIIYDSWLYTEYGKIFQKIVGEKYCIKKIIHFKNGAFDKINIGATIILISNSRQEDKIEYSEIYSPKEISKISKNITYITSQELANFSSLNKLNLDFESELFTKIKDISNDSINRGTSTIVNKFFIFDTKKFENYMKAIIKDVKKIKKMSVQPKDESYLLAISSPNIKDTAVKKYLKEVYFTVKKYPLKYKDLANKIKKNNWFVIKGKKSGNIIFNYYIRNNNYFLYNQNETTVSDNFYNLYVKEDLFVNLCILNSVITKSAIYKMARSQGRGLFKIQLEQFNDLPIINAKKIGGETYNKLDKLGRQLIFKDKDKINEEIDKIDELLIKEINKIQTEKVNKKQLHCFINKIKMLEK